jgi:hypothetical protein
MTYTLGNADIRSFSNLHQFDHINPNDNNISDNNIGDYISNRLDNLILQKTDCLKTLHLLV